MTIFGFARLYIIHIYIYYTGILLPPSFVLIVPCIVIIIVVVAIIYIIGRAPLLPYPCRVLVNLTNLISPPSSVYNVSYFVYSRSSFSRFSAIKSLCIVIKTLTRFQRRRSRFFTNFDAKTTLHTYHQYNDNNITFPSCFITFRNAFL